MSIRGLLVASAALPLISFAQDKAVEQDKVAIQGVRLVIGTGSELPVATVCIAGGKITSVEPGETAPEGYRLVKAQGKVLYPGFIDAHFVRGVKTPPFPSDVGKPSQNIAAPSSLWVGNRKGITPEFKASENLELTMDKSFYEAGFTSVNVIPGSGSFRGSSTVIDLLPASIGSRVLQKETASSISFRFGSGTGYPSNILGQIALMRQVLWDAKSVSEGASLYPAGEKEPSWMSSLNALQPVVKGNQPVFFEANLDRDIERAFALKEEFGFKIVIAGARDAYKHLDLIKANARPVVASVDLGSEPSLTPSGKDDQTPQEYRQERYDRWKLQTSNISVLLNAGITVALSAGGKESDFLKNIRALDKMGVPRPQILAGLTTIPAALLNVSEIMGTVQVGKKANIILASGDLFSENAVVNQAWVDGRSVYSTEPTAPKGN